MDWNNLILVLSSLGIAQALFLCLYLFTLKKGNRQAHILLALLIIGLTLRIGKSIFNEYMQLQAWERNLGLAGILLVGPSLWFYGKTVLLQVRTPLKEILPHFIPYLLFSIFCFAIPNRFDTFSFGIYYALFAHLLLYLVLAVFVSMRSRNQSSSNAAQWYRNLIIGVAIIWVFYIGNVSGLIPFYIGGAICYTFLVYIFSFLLLKKHTFQLEKYQGQRLDKQVSKTLIQTLETLFQEEKVYLNQQITLAAVAKSIGSNSKTLSRVINETTGKNFSEYVNTYRIEKAKNLLSSTDNQKEKIATIAYDSGFNNVTSFNLAFKAMTKLTPSEFRRQSR